MDENEIDRRTLLRLAAASTVTGTAGCSKELDEFEIDMDADTATQEQTSSTDSPTDSPDGTGGQTETETPPGAGTQAELRITDTDDFDPDGAAATELIFDEFLSVDSTGGEGEFIVDGTISLPVVSDDGETEVTGVDDLNFQRRLSVEETGSNIVANINHEAPGNVVIVAETGGDYEDVGAAISDVSPPVTIRVAPGDYEIDADSSPLTIPDGVALVGYDPEQTTLYTTGAEAVVETSLSDGGSGTIEALTLEQWTDTSESTVVVEHDSPGELELRDTIVKTGANDSETGVEQTDGTMVLENSEIVATSSSDGGSHVGISALVSESTTRTQLPRYATRVRNCVIRAESTGVATSGTVVLQDCYVYAEDTAGIAVIGGTDSDDTTVVQNCSVRCNGQIGIEVGSGENPDSDDIRVRGSVVRCEGSYGVLNRGTANIRDTLITNGISTSSVLEIAHSQVKGGFIPGSGGTIRTFSVCDENFDSI